MLTGARTMLVALVAAATLVPVASASSALGVLGDGSCEGTDSTTCTCGGTDTGVCTTGTHSFTTLLSHTCLGEQGFTGTIQSILQHAGGARVFTCVWDAGKVVTADGRGPYPARGEPFTQYCDGVGVGPWACSVTWT
jgi:hypothetical protein